jgi:hypothetical protein
VTHNQTVSNYFWLKCHNASNSEKGHVIRLTKMDGHMPLCRHSLTVRVILIAVQGLGGIGFRYPFPFQVHRRRTRMRDVRQMFVVCYCMACKGLGKYFTAKGM